MYIYVIHMYIYIYILLLLFLLWSYDNVLKFLQLVAINNFLKTIGNFKFWGGHNST